MWLMTPEEDSVEAVPFRFLISLGGWFAFAQVASVVFGVIGYFAWPYAFSKNDATAILEGIQHSPAAYFMKLDPVVLFGTLLQFPVWLGLWSALRRSDPAKSVLALSLGGISTIAILPTRPILEMYSLSSLFASADTIEERRSYEAATQALLASFHGTSWAVSLISGGLAAIVFATVMLRSSVFRRVTIWTMYASGTGAILVLIPVVGLILLFLFGTIVGAIGTVLCGVDLLTYSRTTRLASISPVPSRTGGDLV